MATYRRLLVIDQHRAGNATKVSERLHNRLIRVFRILTVGTPDVKAARVAQAVDGHIHFATVTGNHRMRFTPIML